MIIKKELKDQKKNLNNLKIKNCLINNQRQDNHLRERLLNYWKMKRDY